MTAPDTIRIGLVSDTHGLFDPALPSILSGVDRIFHAGDVGSAQVFRDLERIAPVVAVRGNADGGLDLNLPAIAVPDVRGKKALITHYIGEPECLLPPIRFAIEREDPVIVVFGHNHRVCLERRQGVLFVNPGSCGPRRGDLPRTCGILEDGGQTTSVRLFDIEAKTIVAEKTWRFSRRYRSERM